MISLPLPESSVLVLVDMQERLLRAMHNSDNTAARCRMLLQGAALLECPVVVTEQYPKGLGPTVPALTEVLSAGTPVIEKGTFSCFGTESFASAVSAHNPKTLILCGVESHVCVLQTAMDAMASGMNVYIAEDAVSSRKPSDVDSALKFLRLNGAGVLSAEAILFLLLRTSKHPAFKGISALVR